MKKLRALIVGQEIELIMSLPSLLVRSGFEVDCLSNNHLLKKNKYLKNYHAVSSMKEMIEVLHYKDLSPYDFIILTNDEMICDVAQSSMSIERKLKLLPVCSEKNFSHLFSKIGLSEILTAENITTPQFFVAQNFWDLKDKAERLGYPCMVKLNSSNGGRGVFECQSLADFDEIKEKITVYPVLLQQKIIGRELDLSAIYQAGELIHFSYSVIEKVIFNKFGPSSLRNYYQLGNFDEKLFSEMKALGKALGADGFTTISCIHSFADNKRYFIEADMRPNAWVEFPRFIGDDPAQYLRNWFSKKEGMSFSNALNANYPLIRQMPYFLRIKNFEVLTNRYQVWSFMSFEDWRIFFRKNKFLARQKFRQFIANLNFFSPKLLQRFFSISQRG